MRLNISATSVRNIDGVIYVTISEEGKCRVSKLKNGELEDVITVQGSPCILLWNRNNEFLVSAGNVLYFVSNSEFKPVLRARHGNWFWHAVEACNKVFIQEYGESPTGIYVSEDLEDFELLVSNKDIDPLSRHFHYITFDEERRILITTLGDGNIARVAISADCGSSWRPLYKGPWQFVPLLVERDRWVFGFDSGIAKGGVAIYNFDEDDWVFAFLKPDGYRFAQFTSITRFNDYYVGCLGYPTAILVSKDLLHWYPLHIDPTSTKYNHFIDVAIWRDKVVAATGKELLIFDSRDVEEALRRKPFLAPYKAYLDRVRGILFMLKKLPWIPRV